MHPDHAEGAARPHHLFIVHLWREPGRTPAEGQWRGSVEHVPSGQRRYFADFQDLTRFLSLQLSLAQPARAGAADPPPPGARTPDEA